VAKQSAGVLLYRIAEGALEVLLVHPGGPFWAKKDAGAWSIPKGEYGDGDDPLEAAVRELREETGIELGAVPVLELGSVKQRGGKVVVAWAASGDFDPATLRSNTFSMEWPPRSGRFQDFPEVDRAEWFGLDAARAKLLAAQVPFLDRLAALVEAPER
jgi:predicted NUDIX family NTP pyrophosphohydrolase